MRRKLRDVPPPGERATLRGSGPGYRVVIDGRVRFRPTDQVEGKVVVAALRLYERIFACPRHSPAFRHPERRAVWERIGGCTCDGAWDLACRIAQATGME